MHYKSFELVNIPTYMDFDKANLELNIEVSKLGIDYGKQV